jgi:hypothetical protein
MAAGTTFGSGRPTAGREVVPSATRDVVSARERTPPPPAVMVRAAIGFRVDCPEGRVGVLTAVFPEDDDVAPDRIEIASGLFILTALTVPFRDVVSVDRSRRRVSIGVVPERRRGSRRAIARRVHEFLRAGGR